MQERLSIEVISLIFLSVNELPDYFNHFRPIQLIVVNSWYNVDARLFFIRRIYYYKGIGNRIELKFGLHVTRIQEIILKCRLKLLIRFGFSTDSNLQII